MILIRRALYASLGAAALTTAGICWAYRTFRQADLP